MTDPVATPISAVAFDIGGVLLEWNPRYLYRKLFGADEVAMEQFLAEVCTPEWNARLDAGRPFAEAVAELVATHPDRAPLIEAYHRRWPEMLGSEVPGTVEILRELRTAGFPTYALSNWSAETFPLTQSRFTFLREMDGVLISGEAGAGKPDPAIFREFLRRFDLVAGETVFIDDWDRNIATARGLGMVAIQFTDAATLRTELRALGLPLAEG